MSEQRSVSPPPSRIGPTEPDDTMVICPVCTSQFRAIPLDVQRQLAFLSAPKGSEAAALGDEIERLRRRVAELERAVEEICRERATPPITRARLRHALAGVDWRKAR